MRLLKSLQSTAPLEFCDVSQEIVPTLGLSQFEVGFYHVQPRESNM